MRGEVGAALVEGQQVFLGEVALEGQGCIDSGTGVALAHDQLVTVFPLGIAGIDAHFLAVENCQQFHDAHRAAHMAEAQVGQLLQGLHANFFGKDAKFLIFFHC